MEKKKKGKPQKTNKAKEKELNNNSFNGSSKRRNSSPAMEEKNRVAKKKGRPFKQKRLYEEELNSSSFDCVENISNASSSSSSLGSDYACASPEGPKLPRPRTRSALSPNKKAAVSSQSGIPVQSIDVNSSENLSLLLVKQILFPSNTMGMDKAKDTHSEIQGISPDKAVENQPPSAKKVLDFEKFSSDLLAQAASDEVMVNENNLPEKDNLASNVSAKETPQNHEDPTTDVEGYKVKREVAPLLKAIFKKYGDIARESTFSMDSRSFLLELVCSIYKRLEASRFMQLTKLELESMLGQIGDLKLVKVDVGWLQRRLEGISKERETCEGVSSLEELKARKARVVNEKQRAVRGCEEELRARMADAVKLQKRLKRENDELAAAQVVADEIDTYDGSLVKGLV